MTARRKFLFTFAPNDSQRRYLPLSDTNPQHLPKSLSRCRHRENRSLFLGTSRLYPQHNTPITNYIPPSRSASSLTSCSSTSLPPSAAPCVNGSWQHRSRLQYGRTQILEWYLNSANFGRYAFGADAASQLYFGKSATQLTPAESAILAAVSDSPSLNPYDAPQTALERGRETIELMQIQGLLSAEAPDEALGESPLFQTPPSPELQPAAAFVNLLLAQLDSQFPRERIERGGLTIISTLDYDLQKQSSCVTAFYAARLAGLPDPVIQCDALAIPAPRCRPEFTVDDSPQAPSSPIRKRDRSLRWSVKRSRGRKRH